MVILPFFMFVPNSSPARSVAEFVAFAKANRGKVKFGSPGTGTPPHLAGELLKQLAGIEMTHVPYRGASDALNDLIPGRIDLFFASGSTLEQSRAGQIRALAVSSARRDDAAPELPAIAETIPGFDVTSWYALFVPAKTPPQIIEKLSADHRYRARRPHRQRQTGAARLYGRRLHPRRVGGAAQLGNRQMGHGHQGGRHWRHRMSRHTRSMTPRGQP